MAWQPTLAVSTACFDGYSLDRALKELADLGAPSVELAYIDGYVSGFSEELFSDVHGAEVRELLADAGVSCSAVSAHTDLSVGDALDRVMRRIRFGKAVGAACVVTNAAVVENRSLFVDNLAILAQEAEQNAVELLLENPGDGKENVVNDGSTAVALATELGSGAVGINYDFGNVVSHFFERVRPEEDWLPLRRIARYFHLKDVSKEGANYAFPALGSGLIDYERILDGIAKDQSVPALGIELPLRLRRRPDASPFRLENPLPVSEIRRSVSDSLTFVRRHLGIAGGS